jgi:hypothetical protein
MHDLGLRVSVGVTVALGAMAACSSSFSPGQAGHGSDGGTGDDSSVPCCSSSSGGTNTEGGGGEGGGQPGPDGPTSCQTKIDVTVLDPSGKYPLPGVNVFVSDAPLPAIAPGALGKCPSIGSGAMQTGADGTPVAMTITSAPGMSHQVVAQIGKWRTTGTATACQQNTLKLILPAAGPALAISTGTGDSTECALHRMGLDPVVTIFRGTGGAQTTPASLPSSGSLWDTLPHLEAYDAVVLSCEGAATTSPNSPILSQYLQAGGMVFAEHWHYVWFTVAPFASENIATWTATDPFQGAPAIIATSTPSEMSRKQWLTTVGALSSAGELPVTAAGANATLSAADVATAWMTKDQGDAGVGPPALCSWTEPVAGPAAGRVAFSGFHVGATSGDYGQAPGPEAVPTSATFPSGCASESDLKPEEKAFLYTLFVDLSCTP